MVGEVETMVSVATWSFSPTIPGQAEERLGNQNHSPRQHRSAAVRSSVLQMWVVMRVTVSEG